MLLHELNWHGNKLHWEEAALADSANFRLFRHNSPQLAQYWPLPYYVILADGTETNCDALEAQCWLFELLKK